MSAQPPLSDTDILALRIVVDAGFAKERRPGTDSFDALNNLNDAGLVMHVGNGWKPTEDGKLVVAGADEDADA